MDSHDADSHDAEPWDKLLCAESNAKRFEAFNYSRTVESLQFKQIKSTFCAQHNVIVFDSETQMHQYITHTHHKYIILIKLWPSG